MPDARRSAARRAWVPLTAVAVAIAAVCALAAWRPWSQPAPASAGAEAAEIAPAPLVLPDHARVLVFGDSWTYGSAAAPPTLGYAHLLADLLDAEVIVDGVRGSGYLKPGIDGPSFGDRIRALDPSLEPDLIILQGSINDRRLYPAGYVDAVSAAWDDLAERFPRATVVVLGPAPQVLPVERPTAAIDADLARLAAARSWWYISPLRDDWITPDNYLEVIDTGPGNDHPSTAGHAYLAGRLTEALAALAEGTDVAADAPSMP
ncbi:hypothetical protein GCM10022200_11940 [Microbacterium awajiense]|uniref:SGNH hydrolase-type esterase domain-containing protein n=1 Tax=Microbacterium awajiense TaxID=415214 RepID=A0ABP7AET7_9MICO